MALTDKGLANAQGLGSAHASMGLSAHDQPLAFLTAGMLLIAILSSSLKIKVRFKRRDQEKIQRPEIAFFNRALTETLNTRDRSKLEQALLGLRALRFRPSFAIIDHVSALELLCVDMELGAWATKEFVTLFPDFDEQFGLPAVLVMRVVHAVRNRERIPKAWLSALRQHIYPRHMLAVLRIFFSDQSSDELQSVGADLMAGLIRFRGPDSRYTRDIIDVLKIFNLENAAGVNLIFDRGLHAEDHLFIKRPSHDKTERIDLKAKAISRGPEMLSKFV